MSGILKGSAVSSQDRMTLIAGPCVIEDQAFVLEVAAELKRQLAGLPVEFYFKASFDKANRTSQDSFRGPGMVEGLKILDHVRAQTGLPLVTDLHTPDQAQPVAEVVDYLQIPAFLCRQTDLIEEATRQALAFGRRLNIKKGQFLAPWDAKNIVGKCRAVVQELSQETGKQPARQDWLTLTERGVTFGYNTLIVDMISFQTMRGFGVPTIYDATHSIQVPGGAGNGDKTGGKREFLETLARAAMAAGADGLFMEVHPEPARAKSDGPNALYLEHAGAFVKQLLEIRTLVRGLPKLLPEAQSG